MYISNKILSKNRVWDNHIAIVMDCILLEDLYSALKNIKFRTPKFDVVDLLYVYCMCAYSWKNYNCRCS